MNTEPTEKNKKPKISLSDHFSYGRLLRFTVPSVLGMFFTSIYTIVDGYFVSNYTTGAAFAALNLVYPFTMLVSAFGFMMGAGGSALVAKIMGEEKNDRPSRVFTTVCLATFAAGIVLSVIAALFLRPASYLLGADDSMIEYCVTYGSILFICMPFFIMQCAFGRFLVTAERPSLGFWITVISGVMNMILDWLFVAVLDWGLAGAAWATGIAQIIGAVIPFIIFLIPGKSSLKITRPLWQLRPILKSAANGVGSFLTNISSSLVGMVFNLQLMKYAGQQGVNAFGVVLYLEFIFLSISLGYSVGVAPIFSYNLGAKNNLEMQNLMKKSLIVTGICNVLMFVIAELGAVPMVRLFVGYSEEMTAMTLHGMRIYAVSFLIVGFCIFISNIFAALNDGTASAVISFFRMFVFQLAAVLLLPLIWGLDGIWASRIVSEFFALVIATFFLIRKKDVYQYFAGNK